MKLRAALLCTVLWMPAPAQAIPVQAFFVGLGGVGGTTAAVATALAPSAFAVGSFLGTTALGNLLLSTAASAIFAQKPKAPAIDDAQVNSRLSNAIRWTMGGEVLRGSDAGVFGEYDNDGNFWYIMVHGDAELIGEPEYLLDNVPVELSDGTDGFEAGDVITDAFCTTPSGDQYEGEGARSPVWRIYTVTPDASNVYGTKPSDFTDAFTDLPDDFNGAGVCYSIIRGRLLAPAKRNNGYRWRGPFGLGEPSVSVRANFSRMYDPRNAAHDIDDSSTWTAGDGNPAIVWAWWRTSPRGRKQPMSRIDWEKVAEWADIFDTTVEDREGNDIPLYRCGVAFPENKPRSDCEADILATCGGFVAYGDDGRAYVVGGYYQTPTVTISAARDIFASETVTVDDGERPMDGVVVEYISPDHGYTKQPSAPWVNTAHYDGVSEPNYLTVPILGCYNHNQAVRLAKAIGLREQAKDRAAYTTTIKAILAKNERAVLLDHDDVFNGPHEIIVPVEEDASGRSCQFAVVPLQADRWTLNAGEEGEPPQPTPVLDVSQSLELAQNVTAVADPVTNSVGAGVRIKVEFDAPDRVDRIFRFRHVLSGVESYLNTDMDALEAVSGPVSDGQTYRVSWQTVTAGGRATVWSDERDTPEFIDVQAIAGAPLEVASIDAPSNNGPITITMVMADDVNLVSVELLRNNGTDPDGASVIATLSASRNQTITYVDSGLAPDNYYYWARPLSGSGVAGPLNFREFARVT